MFDLYYKDFWTGFKKYFKFYLLFLLKTVKLSLTERYIKILIILLWLYYRQERF